MATGTDVLNFILPNPAWAEEWHFAVAGVGGQPIYTWLDAANKRFWIMKGSEGWPWDGNSFDENYIYQNITESNWTSPAQFKMFASASWPKGNGGIVWSPRYFDPDGENLPIETADSTYRTYSNCSVFTSANLGGPIQTKIEGPYPLSQIIPDFGSALPGDTPVIVQIYQWGAGLSTLEFNVYALGYGLIQWQLYNDMGGIYALKQTSLFSELVAGGVPALDFPCAVPTI